MRIASLVRRGGACALIAIAIGSVGLLLFRDDRRVARITRAEDIRCRPSQHSTEGLIEEQPRAPSISCTGDNAVFAARNDPRVNAGDVYRPNTLPSLFYDDVIRSTATVRPGANAVNTSAFTGYLLDRSGAHVDQLTHELVGAGVIYFGMGIADVDNSSVWGGATFLSDDLQNRDLPHAAGRGIIAHEYDLHAGASTTKIYGINLLLGGSPAYAQAISVDARGGKLWNAGILCNDGAIRAQGFCITQGLASAPAGVTPIGSQANVAYYFDGSRRKSWTSSAMSNGNYLFANDGDGDFQVAAHIVPLQRGAPRVENCGSSARVDRFSFDQGGRIDFGDGPQRSCSIRYGKAFRLATYPVISPRTAGAAAAGAYISQADKDGFVITLTAPQITHVAFDWSVNGQ